MRVVALVAVLVGCGSGYVQPTPAENERTWAISSWRGVDLIVLERHPLFSYRTPVVRTLSDGTESWVYSSCRAAVESRSGVFLGTTTTRTEARESCCISEFLVDRTPEGGKRILEYRPRGCATDCTAAAHGCEGQ